MAKRMIRFGVIGCGLMGREFASAAARWCHLLDLDFAPQIVAACDTNPAMLGWFEANLPDLRLATADYHRLLADQSVEAVYCAVPHNQHAQIYIETIRAGKHLLGEKPFGIDLAANNAILEAARQHPQALVRCSSEFPFLPGPYRISQWLREGRFGTIIDMEAGFWHSSDLNPLKAINWKRRNATNGEYGCMGDLGLHVVHLPLRAGLRPRNVRALLSKIVTERPDKDGKLVPCETWDNAILACEASEHPTGCEASEASEHPKGCEHPSRFGTPEGVPGCEVSESDGWRFPMLLSVKRIAPGNANTWFIRINGTALSVEFSTKNPKRLRWLPYMPGGEQAWQVMDIPYQSAYKTITGEIFEFGFSDSILQMWAAFCDELVNGNKMAQPFGCATPQETAASHRLFTAALESQKTGQTVAISTD